MKYLKPLFEFNNKHKLEILSNSDKFTIAYELELMSKIPFESFEDLQKDFKKHFNPIIKKYDLTTEYDYTIDNQLDNPLENHILEYNDFMDIDDDLLDEMPSFDDDILKPRVKGIELKNKKYFNSIETAFNFLDEFYNKLNNTKYRQTKTTGTHINIGFKNNKPWNVLKGYLLLNEDFAVKGFEHRKHSEFASSYNKIFKTKVKNYLEKKFLFKIKKLNVDNYKINHLDIKENFRIIEKDLNNILIQILKEVDEKTVGFNINKLKYDYIEFRYPGGKLNKNTLKEQTLHYCNIVYLCKEESYRRKEYIKRLTNLITTINEK